MVLSIINIIINTADPDYLGITWAFTIAIISLAFFGKFVGCTTAARFSGFAWREASTIGALMSCKGYVDHPSATFSLVNQRFSVVVVVVSLVELIVLNVGLSAGILSQVIIAG